jgi:competence protein ComEC
MATTIHFIDVGQGNMVLIQASSGSIFVFDCNITGENQERVLDYVAAQIGERKALRAFICSHRDADHIRGVKILHARFPIGKIWDSGYPGTTTDSDEYRAYMDLRRTVGHRVLEKCTRNDYGRTRLRYLSAKDDRLPRNANAQGVVIKVEHRRADDQGSLGSAVLPGDSDAQTWRHGVLVDYPRTAVSASILMAAHHGSISFFDDPADPYYHYKEHLNAISPEMTLVSVGPNGHGHPNETALRLYREGSSGSSTGNKVYRTDTRGTMKLTLKDGGGWSLDIHQ